MSREAPAAETLPHSALGDDWTVVRPGGRERRWFLVHGLIRGLFWLIPFVVVALLWVFWFEVPIVDPVPLGILALGALVLLLYLLWGAVYPRTWMVAIGPRDVLVDRGLLWITRVVISYDRVQQIDVISTPTMNRLNLTELVLHTAAGGVRLYALDPENADTIIERVRQNQPLIPVTAR